MKTIIRKWGNSPTLRLNAAAMKLAHFDLEQRVTIKAGNGRIVIEPCDKLEYKLDDLVAGMTAKNHHDEVSFGKPVGQEAL
ncbi:MAG: PbsX family transcriptional regulator [Burkholderiales bacterium]|jgi:antitoxin MazE|nr:PbsX family transcriptional regulator [Burkholderiales bacterium]